MKCPNLNISPYKELVERRGTISAYLLDLLTTDAAFLAWNKQDTIDIDPVSLIITSSDGQQRHIDELLRNYVQIPRDLLIANGVGTMFEGRDVLIEKKYSAAYKAEVISIRLGGEEFIIAPLAYSGAYDQPQLRKSLNAISSLKTEENKEWAELSGWYDLHQEAMKLEDERPYNEEPWNSTAGGVPTSFDEFFRRTLRDVSMGRYLRSLGLEGALTKLAPWLSDLRHINTVPQTNTQYASNKVYQGWFGPVDTRMGMDAKTMLGRALEYAKKNSRPWEAKLLDIILRRYGDHLRNTVVKTTDILTDSEGVQQFSTRDGKGTILLSEALTDNKDVYRVLVHEIVHAVTKQLFSGVGLNAAEAKFVNRLTQLYHLAKASATDEHYQVFSMKGMVSAEEFVSELFSNMEFRGAVQSMVFDENASVWDKFVEWVMDLFGFGKDHFEDIFDVQQLVRQVSNFQRATNHEFPLHASYSRLGTNRSYTEESALNNNESDDYILAKEINHYWENMLNVINNTSTFFELKEDKRKERIRNIEAKIRMTSQRIADIEAVGGDFFVIYDNFLSEAHREIQYIDEKLSYNAMNATTEAERALWLDELQVLERMLRNLSAMANEDRAWDKFLTDEGRHDRLFRDLSLSAKNKNALTGLLQAAAVGTLLPFDSVTEWRWIEKAKVEFRGENKGKKNADYKNRERKYVAQYMTKNKTAVEDDKRKRIVDNLRFLPADIILFIERAMPYQQSTDPIIAMTQLFFNALDDQARAQTLVMEKQFLALYEEYVKVSGRPRSFIDMWAPMLEKDSNGKVTGWIISEYRLGEWHNVKKAEWKRIDDLFKKGDITITDASQLKSDFYNKNVERKYIDAYYDALDKHGKALTEEAEVFARQYRWIVGAFEGDWVDPSAFTVSDRIHLGKILAQQEEKNGYESAGAGFTQALAAVGIELQKDRLRNPLVEAYKKKIAADKAKGKMSSAEYDAALASLSYDTKKWTEINTTDGSGNLISKRVLINDRKDLPFISKMNIEPTPGGSLTTVKNVRYVEGKETLKEDWLNKDFNMSKDIKDATNNMYWHMRETYEGIDRARPMDKRLNLRLPNMRKTSYEMWAESEMSTRKKIWTFLSDDFIVHKDDVAWGDLSQKDEETTSVVKENLRGETNKFPVIYFTGIPEDIEMQSFNLATLFMINAEMSIKHQFLVKAAPQVQGIQEMARTDPDTGHRKVGTKERRKGDERKRAKNPSNVEILLGKMVDDRLYGQHKVANRGGMGWSELLQGVQNYTSLLYLGGNVLATIQNTMYGRISTSLESLTGGMISGKGIKAAKAAYWRGGNFSEMMGDWSQQRNNALVHQIMDMFDGKKDFSARRNDYGRETKMRKWGQADNLMQGHMSGEHYVQTTVALAVLADTLVMNSDGEYVNAQGVVVESPDEAMTLLQAFQKNDAGELILSDVVKMIEWRGHIKTWATEEQMYSMDSAAIKFGQNEARTFLTERMQGLNTLIHGAYGDRAKSEFERYWQFRATTQMRKWLIMGFRRRIIFNNEGVADWRDDFGARTESGKARRKAEGYKQFWERELGVEDYDLGIVNEGIYVTVVKYINAMYNAALTNEHSFAKEAGWGNRMSHVWETFNSQQQANMKRFGVETSLMIMFWTILPALLAAFEVEDDDDDPIDVIAGLDFTFTRMTQELGMYYSISNLLTSIQNPAVSVGFMKNLYNFAGQLFTPWQTYSSGSRSGQLKLWKKSADVVPGVRAVNNLFYLKDKKNYANLNK